MFMKKTIALLLLFQGIFLFSIRAQDYKNPALSIETRVQDLLKRMTLEEKFMQLFMVPGDLSIGKEKLKTGIFGFQVASAATDTGALRQMLKYESGGSAKMAALTINEIQKYFIEESRLGIPVICFDEGLHGLVRNEATVFPQCIGLAATFDTLLMDQVAKTIAIEFRSRGIRQTLSPTINIARDVRWGRVEETFGEDPYLTSVMACHYVAGFEKSGVIATPKHFAVNMGDGGRDSYPIHYSERIMDEIYFPAFKSAIQKAGARSIMTAYNSFDGSPCSANDWLLNKKLKQEWGFKGFVISDANATGGANVLHYTTSSYSESGEQSLKNGLDVIFQTSYDHASLFYPAFRDGKIPMETIDSAVCRVLRAKFQLGLFEHPYVDVNATDSLNHSKKNKAIALEAALKSIVLLKNKNQILPLKNEEKKILVIGQDAANARMGGYSAESTSKISILEGIKSAVPEGAITYFKGLDLVDKKYSIIPASQLFHYEGKELKPGLNASYYNNIELSGTPALQRTDAEINFDWSLYGPDSKINRDWFSASWQGVLIVPESEKIILGIEGNDGYRLYINDTLVIDNWKKVSYQTNTVLHYFEKNKPYKLRIEYFESTGNCKFHLIWNQGIQNNHSKIIEQARQLAMQNDVIIVVAGIHEGEFQDRCSLALPGGQDALIAELCKLNKPVIVIVVGGSAITMDPWLESIDALLYAWYPGEMGGKALSDVLFGKYNPGGKLPVTFPKSVGQLPLVYNHKPTGRGDDYWDLSGEPLFPFGYGLSYTNFKYGNLNLNQKYENGKYSISGHFSITNTGDYNGEEVWQLYLRDEMASVARPVRELKRFGRVALKKGETKEIYFTLENEDLTFLNAEMNYVIEKGQYKIMIGSSSKDIRLREILELK
jgi:beta-glucosidase